MFCGVNLKTAVKNSLTRKASRFFRDTTQTTVGGGFRNTDIRYFDVDRKNDGCSLVVRFESQRLREEFNIQTPQMEIDDEFMRTVYSG